MSDGVYEEVPLKAVVSMIYEDEIERLGFFKQAIYSMASRRKGSIDEYIMAAKQAIDDYERMGGQYSDTRND